jgi:hypothetical protein
MRKKLAMLLAVIAGAIALMIPFGAGARPAANVRSACVVVNGPAHFHLQVGYAPNGPGDCRQLP